MRIYFIFFTLIFFTSPKLYKAQNIFPYQRDWGTYVGGNGTDLLDYVFDGNGISIDSQNNIFLNGIVDFQNGYSQTYYNQFVTGNGAAANLSGISNYYHAQVTSAGQITNSGYDGFGNDYQYQPKIDNNDNKYYVKRVTGQIANLSTPGSWLSQNTDTSSPYTLLLSKYNANNNLVWTTYLPNNGNGIVFVRTDNSDNVYIIGAVNEEISGIGTSGTYQPNFVTYTPSSGSNVENSYVVKLNSAGQKVWGTYTVSPLKDVSIYDDSIYGVSAYNSGMPSTLTTAGTFQPDTPAVNIITKFNAANGQRVWGTFYGTPLLGYTGLGIYDIEANENGVFISGQTTDASVPTYYATPGAFKGQLTGGGDLFISKFSSTGDRIWSTYFGSNGYDDIIGSPNLAIRGNKIVITGNQFGSTDNISTSNSFLTSAPNVGQSSNNMFFAGFNTDGSREWCSYYGGSGSNYLGEQINPQFLNDGSLILWGLTGAQTGIGTEGAAFQFMTNPFSGSPFGFVTKFSPKSELSTVDSEKIDNLKLYDNPNNGNFYISGDILAQQSGVVNLLDISGRIVDKLYLEKRKTHFFSLQNKLIRGNYLVEVLSEKGEKLKIFKMIVK